MQQLASRPDNLKSRATEQWKLISILPVDQYCSLAWREQLHRENLKQLRVQLSIPIIDVIPAFVRWALSIWRDQKLKFSSVKAFALSRGIAQNREPAVTQLTLIYILTDFSFSTAHAVFRSWRLQSELVKRASSSISGSKLLQA